MNRSGYTYFLILPVLLPVVLLSFKRIDKVSFFNHYFKVIEEVELRNSQELEGFDFMIWYQNHLSSLSGLVETIYHSGFFAALFLVFLIFAIRKTGILPYFTESLHFHSSKLLIPIPIRGP